MLTDDEARDLLQRAADTVEVDPTPASVPSRVPRWPAIAAAAAVAVVAVGVAWASSHRSTDPEPSPAPDLSTGGRFQFGPDQVPSVFGLTTEQAADLMRTRGLQPHIEHVSTCREAPGRAMSVVPAAGTLVTQGDEVTIRTPGTARCPADQDARAFGWAFLDFAAGRAGPPPMTPTVVVYDDSGATRLEDAELADWSALDLVRAGLSEMQHVKGGRPAFTTPTLTVRDTRSASCGDRPKPLAHRRGLALDIGTPADGLGIGHSCLEVTLFLGSDGELESVLVVGSGRPTDLPGPPDVVGNSVGFATDRLESAGYRVATVDRRDCAPVGTVAAQTPPWGEAIDPGATVTLGVVGRSGRCNNEALVVPTPLTRAADALVAFARGSGTSPGAETVQLYVDDALVTTLSDAAADDVTAWAPTLSHLTGRVVQSPGDGVDDDGCLVRGELPAHLDAADALRLSAPEPAGCSDDWSLLVWVDDHGLITAVDLLTGQRER